MSTTRMANKQLRLYVHFTFVYISVPNMEIDEDPGRFLTRRKLSVGWRMLARLGSKLL